MGLSGNPAKRANRRERRKFSRGNKSNDLIVARYALPAEVRGALDDETERTAAFKLLAATIVDLLEKVHTEGGDVFDLAVVTLGRRPNDSSDSIHVEVKTDRLRAMDEAEVEELLGEFNDTCPRCGATDGAPCTLPSGKTAPKPHSVRPR